MCLRAVTEDSLLSFNHRLELKFTDRITGMSHMMGCRVPVTRKMLGNLGRQTFFGQNMNKNYTSCSEPCLLSDFITLPRMRRSLLADLDLSPPPYFYPSQARFYLQNNNVNLTLLTMSCPPLVSHRRILNPNIDRLLLNLPPPSSLSWPAGQSLSLGSFSRPWPPCRFGLQVNAYPC